MPAAQPRRPRKMLECSRAHLLSFRCVHSVHSNSAQRLRRFPLPSILEVLFQWVSPLRRGSAAALQQRI